MAIIHKSPLPDVDIPSEPITTYVLRAGLATPDRIAMHCGASGKQYTYQQLSDAIHGFAGGLAARGLGKGDVIALMSPNDPDFAVVFHGAAVAGVTVTTLNPTYTADELRHQLSDSGAKLMVSFPATIPLAAQAIDGTAVTELVAMGEAEGATPMADLLAADPITQVDVDVDDHVVVLPYSSGTTGLAKGVMLTHKNLVANLAQCEHAVVLDDGDALLAVLPFFHIYGMQVLMNYGLSNGSTVVSLPRFDLVRALELIGEFKIAKFFAVPPMVLALAKQPIIDEYDISSLNLVVSGAAPLGAELADEASARINAPVVQAYGMTELSPVSHCTPPGKNMPGSSGVTISNTECRFVDEEGNDQDVGADGEMWVRGPQVMKGYLNNDEATTNTIDADGWLHTGDVAHIDEAGNVFIVDRVKELIKYKGFQVPPAELEALIITHDAVADVAVIGIPEVEAGELPKAFVALKPGAEATEDEIMEFVKGQVASYKQIRLVEFIDEIPKSASGKILRRFLRDK